MLLKILQSNGGKLTSNNVDFHLCVAEIFFNGRHWKHVIHVSAYNKLLHAVHLYL